MELILLLLITFAVAAHRMCLSAIVKDEERVIERFLTKNMFAFDRFDITDTGSADNTVALIKQFLSMHGLSGAVHTFAWIDDFGKAKNYALEKSRENNCDHIAFLDADEEVVSQNLTPLKQTEQAAFFEYMDSTCPQVCNIQIYSNGYKWWRVFSVGGSMKSRFVGSRHEYIDMLEPALTTYPEKYYVLARRDQTRHGRQSNSFLLDALSLERDAAQGVSVARSLFYAGQSYRGIDDVRALEMYRKRVALSDGWQQEQFVAQLRVGQIVEEIEGFTTAMPEYFAAMRIDPSRAEPYFYLAHGLRMLGNFVGCFILAQEGAKKRLDKNHLFADADIFTLSVHDEAAVCSSYLPEYRVESLEYFMYLSKKLPSDKRIADNLNWVNTTLTAALRTASLPNSASRTKLLRLWKQ